jgi:hypothetical protein
MNKSGLFFAFLLLFWISTATHASLISLSVSIDGRQANAGSGTGSPGMGSASMTLDDITKEFKWDINWSGLAGEVTGAHFHGPASPRQNAGIQLGIDILSNSSTGIATLDRSQESDLLAGLWYINIHSTEVPAGEIRGQVNVVPIPATIWFFSSGLLALMGYSKRKKTA